MTTVIGIDPGPTPGIVAMEFYQGRINDLQVIQCTAGALYDVLHGIDASLANVVAVERFVVRGRANAAQTITRDQVANLSMHHEGRIVQRSASEVKPWATDRRLQAAVLTRDDTNLLLITAGMRHARDAARHALFAAVKDGGLPDPLSKDFRR